MLVLLPLTKFFIFFRKVCKNCGCRPQQHNIKVNEAIHEDIVKDLFTAKSRNSSHSTDPDSPVEKDATERRPSQESKKVGVTVPTIRIQSMTLESDKNGNSQSDARVEKGAPEVSTGKQSYGTIVSKSAIPVSRTQRDC